MVLVIGTSITSPERASRTLNGLSVGLCVSASLKASKCTAADDQWSVIWRTASINGRGPQRLEIERSGRIALIVMDRDLVLEFGRAQLVEERGRFRGTRAVEQAEPL